MDLAEVIVVLLTGIEAMRAIRNAFLTLAHVVWPFVVDFNFMVLTISYSVELYSPAVPARPLIIVVVQVIHMMVVLDMLLQVVLAFEAVFPTILPAMRASMTRNALLMA